MANGIEEASAAEWALHQAGIEVILDVVFNYTAEGDHTGPTLSFKGLENQAYYIFEQNSTKYVDQEGFPILDTSTQS